MGAVALVLRARLRLHWRSWLALAALVALVGGFVMAAASTGRRTAAALPDFVARHGYDTLVYSSHPLPGLARIPQVALVTPALLPFAFPARCGSCSRQISTSESFSVFEVPPPLRGPFRVVVSRPQRKATPPCTHRGLLQLSVRAR